MRHFFSKKIICFILSSVLICCFAGCTPMEETIKQPTLKYQTQYPATAQEYNLRINQKIVPVLNTLEGHMSKGQDIIDGKYLIENEIKSMEDTIVYVQEIYESCKVIYPPKSETQRHADTLMQFKRVINALEVHQETLQATTDLSDAKQKELLSQSIDILKSEYTSFKNMFNIAS